MHFEIPIADKRYEMHDIFIKKYTGDIDIQVGKEDTVGDTVYIYKNGSTLYEIKKELITTDTSVMEEMVGARTLKNTSLVDLFFEYPGVSASSGPVPVIEAYSFQREMHENLDGIWSITIDETSPALNVNVKNTSQDADLENLTITLLNRGAIIESSFLATLPAEADTVVPFNIQGKVIENQITVKIEATIPSGAQVRANEGLRVYFNFDDMVVSSAVVTDSLINYEESYNGTMGLADSMSLNFVDLDSAIISCVINNPCAFKLEFIGIVEDAWDRDFARANNLKSIAQLSSITDSSAFAGKVVDDTIFKYPGTTRYEKKISLADLRLFPTWDSDSAKSILQFRYKLRSLSDGRKVQFNKNDVVSIRLAPSQFPFVQISGNFIKPTIESFSSEEKIGFDWEESILDSLKKSFRFESVQMNLSFAPEMNLGSSLDSMKLHLELAEKTKTDNTVFLDKMFTKIIPNSYHSANMEISSLINSWPDTIALSTQVILPEGTGLELHNHKDQSGQYSNYFTIGVNVNWYLKIPLAWKVLDTIKTELELSSFSIEEDLEFIKKMITQPEINLNMIVENNTNFQFSLFALGASDIDKQKLLDVPDSLLYSYSPDVDNSSLFRLFGLQGLSLPPRGNVDSLNVKLDHRAVDALLTKEKCHIRWFLIIPEADSDALTDTDYIYIKAKAVIKGVGNSESLLY